MYNARLNRRAIECKEKMTLHIIVTQTNSIRSRTQSELALVAKGVNSAETPKQTLCESPVGSIGQCYSKEFSETDFCGCWMARSSYCEPAQKHVCDWMPPMRLASLKLRVPCEYRIGLSRTNKKRFCLTLFYLCFYKSEGN